MKRNQLKYSLIWLLLITGCSDNPEAPLRGWGSSRTEEPDKKVADEMDENSPDYVPFLTQDGNAIVSRDSLGFVRSTLELQGHYRLEYRTFLGESETAFSKADYYAVKLEEDAENCRVLARRMDEVVFYELDCLKTPESSQSRFFDIGLTKDDLSLFAADECIFTDLGQEDNDEYKFARKFRVICEKQASELYKARYLTIETWFHPKSPHPSGLVQLDTMLCTAKPCKMLRQYKVLRVDSPWTIAFPTDFDASRCPHQPKLEEWVIRCGDKNCFDAQHFTEPEFGVCRCKALINNVPVRFAYLDSSSFTGTVNRLTFDDEASCNAALAADEQCQLCFK